MRRLLLPIASLAAAGVLAPQAFAHAKLVSTSPRDDAILASAPAEVRVRFDDAIHAGPGNEVVSNSGGSVLAGPPRVSAGGRELVLPLRHLGRGDYSARWWIVSDDGHLEEGVVAFRVGSRTGAGAPRSVLRAEGTRPSVGDAVSRWLFLGGILVAGGNAMFRLLVSGAGRRVSAATLTFALVAVFLGGSSLLHTTHAGGTRFGHVTEIAVLIAAAGAAAAGVSTVYPRLLTLAAAASLALLVVPSLAGHALDPGRPQPLSFGADLVHVVTAAFWVGGLLQLALLLRNRQEGDAAPRWSKLVLPAVAALALTGVARALVELSAVSQLWSTGYGRAILVKSGLFVVLVALGWLSRGRLDSAARLLRSVSAELVVLAVVVAAVAVLTALRPGRDAEAAPPKPVVPRELAQAPAPPPGSVVLARESRELAVALAIQPTRPLGVTATIVGQSGRGVDGLEVELTARSQSSRATRSARPCGHGCYTATLPVTAPTEFAVKVIGVGSPRTVLFPVAGRWPPAQGEQFLARASRVFRRLRTVVFSERLASDPSHSILTTWKLVAPDRFEYEIHGGPAGIIIGTRRWDRPKPGAPWTPSATTLLPQPTAPWGTRIADAHVLAETPHTLTASWLDPVVPAWFTATFDRRSALPIELRMTSPAHFMRHRYLAFNRKVRIEPPAAK